MRDRKIAARHSFSLVLMPLARKNTGRQCSRSDHDSYVVRPRRSAMLRETRTKVRVILRPITIYQLDKTVRYPLPGACMQNSSLP